MDANPFRPPVHEELLDAAATRQYLASHGARLGAAIIDNIAISIGSAVMGAIVGALLGASGTTKLLLEFAVGFAVSCIVQILLFRGGQSVGKRIMRIRIVEYATGCTASVVRILGLRILPIMLLSYVGWFAVGWVYEDDLDLTTILVLVSLALTIADVMPIFGAERRCLHDLLAGTKVVEVQD